MRQLLFGLLAVVFAGSLQAQTTGVTAGSISYVGSQNIYVRFESTRDIVVGDTLFIQRGSVLDPALVVRSLSSTSCSCVSISKLSFSVSMPVVAKNKAIIKDPKPAPAIVPVGLPQLDSTDIKTDKKKAAPSLKQKVSGSIAASVYSNFSNTNVASSGRYQYGLSLNVRNIADSRFSFESHLSFRHENGKWDVVQDNVFNALKVYNLSVNYDDHKNNRLVLGRKINSKISSMGAVDGMQYERTLKNFSLGAILGFRPDYADYGFSRELPQFGVYFSHNHTNLNGVMENSIAIVEQMNGNRTDRRFAYFQQTNSLLKNLWFFGSVEVDLYQNIDDNPLNKVSLSSSYLSVNYKPSKKIGLSASYDNRKNVIYYETYKSFINRLIEIEARQGLGFQANYYTLKNISFGLRTGYRFANQNARETKNMYGYFTWTNIPGLNMTSTLAANYLESGYVDGKIMNLNVSRDFFKNRFYTDLGYQWVSYRYLAGETTTVQNVINLSGSWRFYKKLTSSVNFEHTMEASDRYSRLVVQLRQRF